MTSTEVHIALNVLAELEDENPLLHRRLRRLLPALAQDFARAGYAVSEKALKAVITAAAEAGEPFENLFTQPHRRHHAHHQRSYERIAQRLNKWFDPATTMTFDETIAFGLYERLENYILTEPVTDDFIEKAIRVAASHGHYPIVRLLVDSSINKSLLIKSAVRGAYTGFNNQHHILYRLMKDYAGDYLGSIKDAIHHYCSADERNKFEAYDRLRRRYQETAEYDDEIFTGIESWSSTAVRMGDYGKIRQMLAYEVSNVGKLNQAAYKAALVFQSADRVLRYLERWGTPSKQPLKTLIDGLQAPIVQQDIDWPAWGDALLKYGPEVGYLLHFAPQVKAPLYNQAGEISLRATRDHIWHTCFPLRHQNEALAALVFSLERPNNVFETALEMWFNRYRDDLNQPGERSIPDILLDGSRFGLPGYTLKRMPYDDLRIMFLGDYDGCCERIGDTFEETIEHALGTGESGYFVLMKDNEVRLHTWVWRGEGGQLILDGYETKDPAITETILVDMTVEIGNTLKEPYYEDYDVTDVILGLSNQKFDLSPHFPVATEIATRFKYEWYFPTISQWLVTRIYTPERYAILERPDQPGKPSP